MKIVIAEHIADSGLEMLQSSGNELVYDPGLWADRGRLEDAVITADALIVRNQTRVDVPLLAKMVKTVAIGRLGVGLDNIDVHEAKRRNIAVISAKNANASSVAEYVIAAIFTFTRPLLVASEDVKAGGWDRKRFGGHEIAGKTLGLIGIGEIGHRTAVRAKALGMKVIGSDPRLSGYDFAAAESGIRLASMEEVLQSSDCVSLHIPLLPDTKGLINKAAIEQMQPHAYLINTSRGGVVDEQALYEALLHRRIAGAMLDVLSVEPPPPDHPLLSLDSCVITPHVAGLTEEANHRTSELIAAELLKELKGIRSLCRVV
ncbi:hydroxyacid dehydrogenase [Paenibacillus sp. P96]|uniref:Hydroxyacid dehydrogenase n=1 Tax=Paenibacillus zeirhizosphaerae TaxID=2987519 RepID=A0ABT9FVJ1_9BACL|nr:hydroxyacid dehydrogenase [Paenibacillus sp. P96]MDP4098734.1 hydroxyacid dehydrogenase [Paenibacillus sp. P96]